VQVDENTVTVTVRHPSINLDDHYINKIEVKVNDQTVDEENLGPQKEKQFTATLEIPSLKAGDTVMAIAYCNKWGQRRNWFKVKEKKAKKQEAVPYELKTELQ